MATSMLAWHAAWGKAGYMPRVWLCDVFCMEGVWQTLEACIGDLEQHRRVGISPSRFVQHHILCWHAIRLSSTES